MKHLQTLKIVTLAMMMSGLMYVAVLFVVLQGDSGAGTDMWLPMGAAALAAGVGSFVVPRFLPQSGEGDTELKRAITGYFTRSIVGLAMAEAVILFGFVASFLAQEPLGIFPFLIAGEVLMLLRFPRESSVEAMLDGQALIEWNRQRLG